MSGSGQIDKEKGLALDLSVAGTAKLDFGEAEARAGGARRDVDRVGRGARRERGLHRVQPPRARTTICLRVGNSPLFKILLNADDTFYALPSSVPPFGFPFFGDAEKETGLTLEIAILGFGGNITIAMPRPAMPAGFDVAGLITSMMKGFQGDPGLDDTEADWQSAWDPLKQYLEKQEASILTIFRGPGMGNINLALPKQLRSVFPSLSVGRLTSTAPCESGPGGAGDEVLLFPVWTGMHYLTDLIPALFPDAASDAASVFVHLMHYIVFIKQMMTAPAKIFHLIPEAHRSGSIDYTFAGSAAIHGRYAITDDTPLINTGQSNALPGFTGFVSFAQGVNDPLASRLPLMADVAKQKFALLKSQAFSFVATGTQFSGAATDEWVNPHDQAVQSFQIIPTFVPDGQVFSQNEVLQRHIARMTEKNGGLTSSDADKPIATQDRRASLRLMGSTGRLQVTDDDGKVLYVGSAQLMGLTTVAVPGLAGRLELDAALEVSGTQFTSIVKAQNVFPFTEEQLDQKAQHDSCVAQNRTYQSDLNAYYAWWAEYNRRVQQARNTWANTASNLDWGSIEHAMNKDHSFSCLFTHYSPGDNWASLSSTLGQIGPFIAGLQRQGDGSCSCVRYAREEILSEVSDRYPFETAATNAAAAGTPLIQPMSMPAPQRPYPPQCVDPGAPVQKSPIPLKWTHSAPLFVTGAEIARRKAAGADGGTSVRLNVFAHPLELLAPPLNFDRGLLQGQDRNDNYLLDPQENDLPASSPVKDGVDRGLADILTTYTDGKFAAYDAPDRVLEIFLADFPVMTPLFQRYRNDTDRPDPQAFLDVVTLPFDQQAAWRAICQRSLTSATTFFRVHGHGTVRGEPVARVELVTEAMTTGTDASSKLYFRIVDWRQDR